MIGYCGLNCTQCEAYVATLHDDDALRAKVAEEWSKMYNAALKPADINCTGCQSAGPKTYHCEHLCEIRKCATKRSFSTCADCGDYPCALLAPILQAAPAAKSTLDALRQH